MQTLIVLPLFSVPKNLQTDTKYGPNSADFKRYSRCDPIPNLLTTYIVLCGYVITAVSRRSDIITYCPVYWGGGVKILHFKNVQSFKFQIKRSTCLL